MIEMSTAYGIGPDKYGDELQTIRIAHDEVVKKLRDEIAALRSALQPFAEAGEALDEREFDILYERWGPSGKKHRISMRHLKHAATTYGVTK